MSNKQHFRKSIAICRTGECGHWGVGKNNTLGCLLHEICPGKIDSHLLNGSGCLADPPLFKSAEDNNNNE